MSVCAARVLRHVGNDVALAVDWIMENGDELAAWMSEPEPPAVGGGSAAGMGPGAESGDERDVHVGTRVFTSDGKQVKSVNLK
jgi:hypothetical protein